MSTDWPAHEGILIPWFASPFFGRSRGITSSKWPINKQRRQHERRERIQGPAKELGYSLKWRPRLIHRCSLCLNQDIYTAVQAT